jgi:hypothetical protein
MQNQVKSLHWFEASIAEWTRLAEQTANRPEATRGEIEQALERLVRAESLEAALEVNGPMQPAYERIQACKRKLRLARYRNPAESQEEDVTPSDPPPGVPAEIYAQYHERYRNTTYREFGRALARHVVDGSDTYLNITNLLIDTAFERLGAERFRSAGNRLADVLHLFKDTELFALAEQHLAAFTRHEADRDQLITVELLDLIGQQINDASGLVNRMQHLASHHHRWPGRVASYWISAIVYLLIALHALLQGDQSPYVREKFQDALRQIGYGVEEARRAGLKLKDDGNG